MNKNIIYGIIFTLLSINVYANNIQTAGNQSNTGDESSEIERGKWYQFTSDFFSNCVSEITEVKKQNENKETTGSSVSAVNAQGSVKTMNSCITNSYNPLQPQVERKKISQKGCPSEIKTLGACSFSLVPAIHNQNQKVSVNENSFYGAAEFSCVNGVWQNISATTSCVSREVNKCPEMKVDWGSCSGYTKESKNETTFKLLSSNNKKGYVYMNCKNGAWQISANHISYCDTGSCPLTGKVSWYDQNVIDVIKNKNIVNGENANQYAGNVMTSQSHDTEIQVRSNSSNLGQIEELELNLNNQLPYENSHAYKKLPKCIGEIKSIDGLNAIAEYVQEDKTFFNSITEATEKSNFIKGRANFICSQGNWVLDGTPTCKRETNLNCVAKVVRKVNEIEEKMYQCNFY